MNRLIGRLPKVGIRPVIDGREAGVRESLEDQCMDMAKAAAKLIEENLRFPSGEKVECVIADTTIGGVADAAACADKFKREGVEVSLTVTPCWCYGTEVMDTDPLTPKAVWGFNGTERPGAVYLAAALAGYSQKGLPAFGIYGKEVQDEGDQTIPQDVSEKILRFVKGALAVAQMKGKSYLSIGYSSMGIAGSMVDVNFLQDYSIEAFFHDGSKYFIDTKVGRDNPAFKYSVGDLLARDLVRNKAASAGRFSNVSWANFKNNDYTMIKYP